MSVWIESRKTKHGKRYYVIDQKGKNGVKTSIPAGDYKENAIHIRNRLQEKGLNAAHGLQDRKITVKESIQDFIQFKIDSGMSRNTIRIYRWAMSKLNERFLDRRLFSIHITEWEKFRQSLFSNHDVNGANIIVRNIRTFIKYCGKTYGLEGSIVETFKQEPEKMVGEMLRPEQAQAVIDLGCKHNEELGKIIVCFLGTGLRLSELLSLSKKNVYEDTIHITRQRSKSKRELNIPIHSHIKPVISDLLRFVPKWSKDRLERAFRRAIKRSRMASKVELPARVRVHDLRHTAASWLIQFMGFTIYDVQKYLGHTQSATTQRYAHIDTQYLREKLDKSHLGSYLGSLGKNRALEGSEGKAEVAAGMPTPPS